MKLLRRDAGDSKLDLKVEPHPTNFLRTEVLKVKECLNNFHYFKWKIVAVVRKLKCYKNRSKWFLIVIEQVL